MNSKGTIVEIPRHCFSFVESNYHHRRELPPNRVAYADHGATAILQTATDAKASGDLESASFFNECAQLLLQQPLMTEQFDHVDTAIGSRAMQMVTALLVRADAGGDKAIDALSDLTQLLLKGLYAITANGGKRTAVYWTNALSESIKDLNALMIAKEKALPDCSQVVII